MVRTEFLTAIKRLKNLGYQIIYISKESINEITTKSGSKITTFKPNINDKVANVLAGTVDLTVRAYMDGEERFLQLEKKETIFGGGRFSFKVDKIPLNKEAFLEALKDAQEGIKKRDKVKEEAKEEKKPSRKKTSKDELEDSTTPDPEETSSVQKVQEVEPGTKEAEQLEQAKQGEKPKVRTRKKRGES